MTQAKVKVVKKKNQRQRVSKSQPSAGARERNQNNNKKNKQQKIYSEILPRGPELLLGWSAPRCARARQPQEDGDGLAPLFTSTAQFWEVSEVSQVSNTPGLERWFWKIDASAVKVG